MEILICCPYCGKGQPQCNYTTVTERSTFNYSSAVSCHYCGKMFDVYLKVEVRK